MQITSTKQANSTIKLGLYGNAGTGKTTLAASCPKPLILSAESGLISLLDFDLPVVEVASINDLREAIKFILKGDHDYQTIFVDSLSEIAERILEESVAKRKIAEEQLGQGFDPRQAYGDLLVDMMKLTKRLRGLPYHVVYTAKQGYIEDEKVVKYGPQFPGKAFTTNFPYLMDMLWCIMITKKEGRILRLQPDFQYYCKTRGGHKLPSTIVVPDISDSGYSTFLTRIFEKVLKNGQPQ